MSSSVTIDRDDSAIQHGLALLSQLFPEPRNYEIELGPAAGLRANSTPQFCMVFKGVQSLRRVFKPPFELSMGEGFIHGELVIQGDIFKAFDIMDSLAARMRSLNQMLSMLREYLALPFGQVDQLQGRGPLELHGRVHSLERDRKAVQYHYDVGNDFYSIWLDKNMQYSCGYFPTGAEDLDTAQIRKMEHICRKLRLQPGETILDIGCGWGGLIRYASTHYGVKTLGVTLSKRQAEYATQKIEEMGLSGQCRVELRDYRELSSESFDKIVSVGMFEHVGRSHLPEYFSHAYRLLKPGGLFLNHGISLRVKTPDGESQNALNRWVEKSIIGLGTFSQKYIFPDGELVMVSDAAQFGEHAGFEVRDIENLREHYALTIRNWVKNMADHQAEVEAVTDPVTYRTWRLYLAASVHGFETGSISVNQTLFDKPVKGKAIIPLSRADLYRT
jgi:cyclopropane-fatty-acyl-phospholipid synthase